MSRFPTELRRRRTARRLSQLEMAIRADTTQRHVSFIALPASPVNVFRLTLHPDGLAARVRNLPEWSRHITENLRAQLVRSPDPSLEALLAELEGYLPTLPPQTDVLGFAVPLELSSADGDLRLITTLTSFAAAADVTLAELHLEALLPADESTADVRRRWG